MPIETQNHPRTAAGDTAPEPAPEAGAGRPAGPPSPEARAAAALAGRRAGDEAPVAPVDAVDAAADQGTAGPGRPGAVPAEPASGAGPARRRYARTARTDATLVPVPRAVQDVVLLLGRLVVGVVLIAHGLQKLTQGVAATAEGFAQMGIPLPEAAAVFAVAAEIGGGALLILGLLTPLAALLPAVVMFGAVVVHAGSGIFVSEGGWELAATLGAAALVLGAVGPGRLSGDALIARTRRDR
jgi:putative oxidoreductase